MTVGFPDVGPSMFTFPVSSECQYEGFFNTLISSLLYFQPIQDFVMYFWERSVSNLSLSASSVSIPNYFTDNMKSRAQDTISRLFRETHAS